MKINAEKKQPKCDMQLIFEFGERLGEIETRESAIKVFLGDKKSFSNNVARNAAGEAARALQKTKAKTAALKIDFAKGDASLNQALAEGFILGNYQFNRYKKEKKEGSIKQITLVTDSSSGIDKGITIASKVNMARDLANTPANDLTPADFLAFTKSQIPKNLTLEVIGEKKARQLGMGAFLGVAQGSVLEPYMLVLRYTPNKSEQPICLVGKGVTFDSGGISIKPAKSMSEMKADMSGAAAVLASMLAISELKPKKNVMAVIPLVENMCSGTAQRPGDVVRAMNGTTIEILNTDAEGRLILADALYYATTQNVKEIIDIATLTGACVVAIGDIAAGVMGNDQKVIDKLLKTTNSTGDRLWQLPMYDDYLEYLESEVADIANCSEERKAGACSAAKFLELFTNKTPWAHIDMAGMMHYSKAQGYTVAGMSGFGVRTMVEYVLS